MFAFIYIEERLGERNILLFMTKLVCHEGVCIMRVCVCVCVSGGCVCVCH